MDLLDKNKENDQITIEQDIVKNYEETQEKNIGFLHSTTGEKEQGDGGTGQAEIDANGKQDKTDLPDSGETQDKTVLPDSTETLDFSPTSNEKLFTKKRILAILLLEISHYQSPYPQADRTLV